MRGQAIFGMSGLRFFGNLGKQPRPPRPAIIWSTDHAESGAYSRKQKFSEDIPSKLIGFPGKNFRLRQLLSGAD
jgi:hypothetical protein